MTIVRAVDQQIGGTVINAVPGDPTTGPAVLRRLNTITMLKALRDAPEKGWRITDLMERAHLSRPPVTQVVDDLIRRGLVRLVSQGSGQPTLGRPATRFRLAQRVTPVLGLDLGPHTINAGITDLAGDTLAVAHQRLTGPGNAADILRTTRKVITRVLDDADLVPADISRTVVASPGIIDRDRGEVRLAPSVPGWADVASNAQLRELLPGSVTVENDANLAAVAASTRRPGESLLVLQWGERLGAGVVIEGRLHRGAANAAGELGLIPTGGDPVTFDRSGRGGLEARIGAAGIVDAVTAAIPHHPDSVLAIDGVRITALNVFQAFDDGDALAVRVITDVVDTLVSAITPVLLVLDFDAIIIGGGIARAGTGLMHLIREAVAARTLTAPQIQYSDHAENTVLHGAMELARRQVWQELLAIPA